MIAQVNNIYFRMSPKCAIRRIATRAFFEGRPITTQARWINYFLFAHFEIEKRLPRLKKVINPIFIIGTGRSGTTILGTLLSIHPHIGFLNEPKAMWHSIFPEEDVLGHFSNSVAQYRLEPAHASEEVCERAHRLFGAYLKFMFASRLVDKNPELTFRVPFIQKIFPDAKFVFIVRNGIDTCSSIAKWNEENEIHFENGDVHNWWGVNNRKWKHLHEQLILTDPSLNEINDVFSDLNSTTDRAAVEWIITMREGLNQMKNNPNSFHLLRYEQLLENPSDILTELLSFCDLPMDYKVLAYAEKTLHPSTKHGTNFKIHTALAPIFEATLAQLNY